MALRSNPQENALITVKPGNWYWWIQGERPIYVSDTDQETPDLCFAQVPTLGGEFNPGFEPMLLRVSELCTIIPGLDELDY